jgi:hypothetical protein
MLRLAYKKNSNEQKKAGVKPASGSLLTAD